MPVTPAISRDNNGTIQAAASRLISKSRKPRLKPVAREECDRDREHDEIVVEHVGRREQAGVVSAAALSSKAASLCHSQARLAASISASANWTA